MNQAVASRSTLPKFTGTLDCTQNMIDSFSSLAQMMSSQTYLRALVHSPFQQQRKVVQFSQMTSIRKALGIFRRMLKTIE